MPEHPFASCMYVCMYVCTCRHIRCLSSLVYRDRMYVCMYICMYVYMYVGIYSHASVLSPGYIIYIHRHTHTHTHTHRCDLVPCTVLKISTHTYTHLLLPTVQRPLTQNRELKPRILYNRIESRYTRLIHGLSTYVGRCGLPWHEPFLWDVTTVYKVVEVVVRITLV